MTALFKWYTYRFGQDGNLAAVPDPTQGGGEVSYQQGWGSDYEINPDVDPANAKFIDRPEHNQLWGEVTGNVNYWQQNLYPLYTIAADNGGVAVSYKFGTRVRYDAGAGEKIYEVIEAAGTVELPTVIADWVLVTNAYPVSGTADGEQRTNLQNNTFYDDRYKAFAGTGDILPSSSSAMTARGFLQAEGQEVSRTTYAALFAEIGVDYGIGNGTTTFNLPRLPSVPFRAFDYLQQSWPGGEPSGVSVDSSNGNVWVVDSANSDIYKRDGITGAWAIVGSYPGSDPNGINVNSSNQDVWVTDGAGIVYKLTAGVGLYVSQTYPGSLPLGVVVDDTTQDVFICDITDNEIYKQSAGVGLFVAMTQWNTANQPRFIGVNSTDGTLYVAGGGYVWISNFGTASFTNSEPFVSYPGTNPQGISVNPDTGDIFVNDLSGDIIYIAIKGTTPFVQHGFYNGLNPRAVSVNQENGNLWVSDFSGTTSQLYMQRGATYGPPIEYYIKT